MATEIDFSDGGKPAQLKALTLTQEKGSFGEVHFAGDELKLGFARRYCQETHPCWIADKGLGGEGINLKN